METGITFQKGECLGAAKPVTYIVTVPPAERDWKLSMMKNAYA